MTGGESKSRSIRPARSISGLVEEKNFTGSESSVRNLVHDMRAARKGTKAFVPLRFAPGEAVQIDWGEATVYLNGEGHPRSLLFQALSQLCALCHCLQAQNLESFLDAIIHTFQYYGGVPDGLSLTMPVLRSKWVRHPCSGAQDDYKQLSAHYGFEPVFCNPASGNEKGLVENLVRLYPAQWYVAAQRLRIWRN